MTGKTVPRYVILTAILSFVVVVSLLAVFYTQYRWLTGNLVTSSTEQFEASQAASFERRARGRLHRITDTIAANPDASDTTVIAGLLQTAMASSDELLAGLRYTSNEGASVVVGQFGTPASGTAHAVGYDYLTLSYAVERDGNSVGTLDGSFLLASLGDESAAFAEALLKEEALQRRSGFAWIATTAVLAILISSLVIRVLVRNQSRRISDLKLQALRLREPEPDTPTPMKRRDELGELAQVLDAMRDELQRTTISRDYMDKILSGMNEAIVVTDPNDVITRINSATTRMLGYDEGELLGRPVSTIVDASKKAQLRTDFTAGVPGESFLVSKTGQSIPVSYTGSVIDGNSGTGTAHIYAAQNITERHKAEQRIRYLARIDALTKVPNRMQFQHLLQRAIARAKRSRNSLALFYVDIDHFKDINDTFGHLAGDTTLETVANRLTDLLPEQCVIGRLAGDEFGVIVDRLNVGSGTTSELEKLARKILDCLADPFYVQGHEVFMTASMGIAGYPQDAPNVIDLIRNADAALYSAKKSGGNVFSHYKPEMNEAAVERLMTKSKLKRAFERDELLVHYQPKYNLETGAVIGAEALVRWELPERGIILPADFIPIAEETNLIVEIGEWVLDRVCEDFRYWQRSVSSPGRVSVNLSLKQLRLPNFTKRINGILRSYEVSPTSLELEITETTLMENPTRTIKLLDELYALGLHLAIDDFGTGYSSLSALQQFPISTLKIDKSFVRHVAENPDDATIVGTIIHMGRNLNMDVVAEGVETEEQLNVLQSMHCNYAQGLLFGDPMSSDNYLELLLAQAEGTDKYRALFA